MNNKKENWEKRFDKKFARRNMSTGEFENKWFIKDTIRDFCLCLGFGYSVVLIWGLVELIKLKLHG